MFRLFQEHIQSGKHLVCDWTKVSESRVNAHRITEAIVQRCQRVEKEPYMNLLNVALDADELTLWLLSKILGDEGSWMRLVVEEMGTLEVPWGVSLLACFHLLTVA